MHRTHLFEVTGRLVREVDAIFTEIEPYFAKRWLKVQLSLDSPQAGAAVSAPRRPSSSRSQARLPRR